MAVILLQSFYTFIGEELKSWIFKQPIRQSQLRELENRFNSCNENETNEDNEKKKSSNDVALREPLKDIQCNSTAIGIYLMYIRGGAEIWDKNREKLKSVLYCKMLEKLSVLSYWISVTLLCI